MTDLVKKNAEYTKKIEKDFQESDLTICRECKMGFHNGGMCDCGHMQPLFKPHKAVGFCYDCGQKYNSIGHCACLFEEED